MLCCVLHTLPCAVLQMLCQAGVFSASARLSRCCMNVLPASQFYQDTCLGGLASWCIDCCCFADWLTRDRATLTSLVSVRCFQTGGSQSNACNNREAAAQLRGMDKGFYFQAHCLMASAMLHGAGVCVA